MRTPLFLLVGFLLLAACVLLGPLDIWFGCLHR
jgi:hypothetical protein